MLTLMVLAGGGAWGTSPVRSTSVTGNSRLAHVASYFERQRTVARARTHAALVHARCAWVDAGMPETYEKLRGGIRFCKNKLWSHFV